MHCKCHYYWLLRFWCTCFSCTCLFLQQFCFSFFNDFPHAQEYFLNQVWSFGLALCSLSLGKMLNHISVITQLSLLSTSPIYAHRCTSRHRRNKHRDTFILHTLTTLQRNSMTHVPPQGKMCSLLFPRTKSSLAQRAISLHKSDHRSLGTYKHKHTATHTVTKTNVKKNLWTLKRSNFLGFTGLAVVLWNLVLDFYSTNEDITSLCTAVVTFMYLNIPEFPFLF